MYSLYHIYHIIFQGTSVKTMLFRQWYANIVELKSLLHDSTRFAIFAATATKATKNAIYQMLSLNALSTFTIEKPPLRENITYQFAHISKDESLDKVFGTLIEELKLKGRETERCIIFCQTHKQCSLAYRLFTSALGNKNFVDNCRVRITGKKSIRNKILRSLYCNCI